MTRAQALQASRREPAATPARIAPLANLPLFHRLTGRKAVVAGGSDGALWKAELLAAAGADVLVLAGEGAEKFEAIAALTVLRRSWTPADLEGAALAVADPGSRDEALRFVAAARAAGVPVNVIDQTDLCDVQFGTIVNRSPVVLAISTGGAAPMLGQSIRAQDRSRPSARPFGLGQSGAGLAAASQGAGEELRRPARLLGAVRRARLGRRRRPTADRSPLFEPRPRRPAAGSSWSAPARAIPSCSP